MTDRVDGAYFPEHESRGDCNAENTVTFTMAQMEESVKYLNADGLVVRWCWWRAGLAEVRAGRAV